jgi:GT2 family glycosyltransferase
MKSKDKPTVSLIVLNYNGRQHLYECFKSIFRQSKIPDEVILFDNDSIDGSIEYVKKNFPKVKIVSERGYNTGTAKGSNIAFASTKGDYVIFQSNDIRLDRYCVEELLNSIDKNKKIGICTSVNLHYLPDNKGKYFIDNAGGWMDMFGFGIANFANQPYKSIPKNGEVFFSYGSSFIIKRKLFKKLDGFEEKFFNLHEDIDLSWRVRLLDYKIIYNKKSIVYHKGSATLRTLYKQSIKRFWSEKNIMRSLIKNSTILHLFLILPLYLGILFGEMFYFLYRRKFSLFGSDLKALIWNIYYLPDTLKKRFEIQSIKRNKKLMGMMTRGSYKLIFFKDFRKAL